MYIDVKDARRKLGLTQTELASLLGVTTVTISRWENGHVDPSPYQAGIIQAMLIAQQKQPGVVREAQSMLVTVGVIAALGLLLYLATRD